MTSRVIVLGLWLVLILTVAGTLPYSDARAQGKGRDEVSEARALFMAGRSAFVEGRYRAALDYFEKSYELSGKPRLLYNIGQCHDRLRNDAEAIDALQRYLEEAPEAENRHEVEARLEHLRAAVQAREAQNVQEQTASESDRLEEREREPSEQSQQVETDNRVESTPEPDQDLSTSDAFPIWPTVTIAAGAVASIVGTVLMVIASSEGSDVEQAPIGSSYEKLKDKRDGAEQKWVVGQVLIGVGAAAAASGVAWLVLSERSDSRAPSVSVTPNGLSIRGGF